MTGFIELLKERKYAVRDQKIWERRKHPRIYRPMPLKARGEDFSYDTVTQNLSAGGVCLRSSRKCNTGDALGFLIEFSIAGSNPPQKPSLLASGLVTRVRNLGDGTFEFAAKFTQTKLV